MGQIIILYRNAAPCREGTGLDPTLSSRVEARPSAIAETYGTTDRQVVAESFMLTKACDVGDQNSGFVSRGILFYSWP
jgi:hypothetical protein